MKGGTLLGIVFGGLGIGYVATYFQKQTQLLKDTAFKYEGGRILKFGLTNIVLLLRFKITNKSNTNLTIYNQQYEVFIGGKSVANLESKKETLLPKQSDAFMDFNVSFNPSKLLSVASSNIRNYLTDKSSIKIKTVGELGVKSGIIFKNSIPVEFESSLADFIS